ncbi:Protein of unknown function [Prosthecobacter debontii]|uniref:Tat (Twin-arginine translocation) pathway signal sequence n=1 Tax=Prosthecobacter debontii TaxID=48467 RepID=A0A1T4YU93_9BACT|nr:DUF1501 domain-containing protein [Prosthecobacter debontii]SKB05427.1 Protein of unknown function [Prosthecobacter debontii]
MSLSFHSLDCLSRRQFAEQVAKTALGVTLIPHLVKSEGVTDPKSLPGFGKAKNVIWLQMLGGMSHIDTLDPKTGDTKGPGDPITTKAGYQLGAYLPNLAKDHSEKLAIIRSMTSKTGVHASGQYLMRTGYEQRGTIKHPVLGAWAQELLGKSSQTLPSSVCVGRGPESGNGFFSAGFSPLPIHDPEAGLQYAQFDASAEIMSKRLALLNKVDSGFRAKFHDSNLKAYTDFYDDTLKLLSAKDLDAFKLTEESSEAREKYGMNKFGQGCMLARRLVERGVRFIEVAHGGWDMHNDIGDGMEDNGGILDTALAALLSDLQERGLLQSTLVVLCSEFGRSPKINSRSGRDHHPKVFSTLLAGGPVKGGTIYGASDKEGNAPADKQVTIQDFHSTVGHAMGMDVNHIVMSPSNRPFTVGDKGSVITELLA